ncbi:acetylcholinesterase-like [Homalodisca vitripennis]|uniref:acetylcholinesterase-like n=1 Tax=Homalodisca vitripennis TaxID=197043 RepID=UPI001EEA0AC2|nr:acetylcholinesterase-like [Homalodisca vitripennis]
MFEPEEGALRPDVVYGRGRCQSDVPLNTKRGPIVGTRFSPNPDTKVSYDAFLGIPYGQIPARFQMAVPRTPWSTAKDTKTDGPACPQIFGTFKEDCLYLNVFTPVNAASSPSKYPVMAFVHGSAFTASSSSSLLYGPDFLIPENVILVTFNYRLGAVGFLTLGSKVAPGNLGLTDTLLALQWIQDEISIFGGDPDHVTLFGESAGSAIVTSHYLSSLSTDLFVNAIAQSGSVLSDWAVISVAEGTRRAKVLAQALGCNITENDRTLLSCLQKADINDIVAKQSIVLPSEEIISGSGGLRFVPVLDSYLMADVPFFNDTLEGLKVAAMARGKSLIIGITTDDGIVKFLLDDSWKEGESNVEDFIPRRVRDAVSPDRLLVMGQDIHDRYFPDTFDQNKVLSLLRLNTDTLFSYPAAKISNYFANLTYGYVFKYYGSWSQPIQFPYQLKTVNHGSELPYIFYFSKVSLPLDSCSFNAENIAMKNKMVNWWTTFAKYGSPGSQWGTVSTMGYMVIDSTNSIMSSSTFNSEYFNFWDVMEKSDSSTLNANVANLFPTIFIIISTSLLSYS